MPQDIRVLQCLECNIFQADIVKKSKKWKCRVCGAEQTVRKEIYRGTGTECRTKVQELNMQQGCRQSMDLNCLLKHLNNGEENNKISSCSMSGCNLHNGDDEEINSSNIDKAKENVATVKHNAIDWKMTKEKTNMFNMCNTQKWSKDKTVQKSLKLLNVEYNDGNAKQKSKWDSYV